MSLKHGLLGLLNYGRMTGYELDQTFKDSLNFFWQAQTSQIYRELNLMEKSGWLSSEIEIQTGKPNKKLYAITNTGKQELLNWLAKDSIDKELLVRSEFLMKLFFAGERNIKDNLIMLKAYKSQFREALAALSPTGNSIEHYGTTIADKNNKKTMYWKLTAQFGKTYMKMCRDFADAAIKILEENNEHSGT